MNNQIKFEALGPKLAKLEQDIINEKFLNHLITKDKAIKWAGAGVVIASENAPHSSSDYFLITQFAKEIAWYFDVVKEILYDSNLIDHLSKFTLFKNLAKIAEDAPDGIEAKELLLLMQLEIKKIAISWDEFDS